LGSLSITRQELVTHAQNNNRGERVKETEVSGSREVERRQKKAGRANEIVCLGLTKNLFASKYWYILQGMKREKLDGTGSVSLLNRIKLSCKLKRSVTLSQVP
jgi:hypothetical protein